MQDEPEPPRKTYGFKPREFERANTVPPSAQSAPASPVPDPGIPEADPGKINVHDLIRAGTSVGPLLGSNAAANRENDVHAILRDNHQRDLAAGRYDLGKLNDSKRRRRIRNYCLALAVVDLPLGAFAHWIGHEMAMPFVCAISGMAMFTIWMTWETFFLRTHY